LNTYKTRIAVEQGQNKNLFFKATISLRQLNFVDVPLYPCKIWPMVIVNRKLLRFDIFNQDFHQRSSVA